MAAASGLRSPAAGRQGGSPILFSNPASFEGVNQLHTREIGSAARRDLTVRVSYDECRAWPVARRIDEDAGYPPLVVLDDGTILCGYGVRVCCFNLALLEGGEPHGAGSARERDVSDRAGGGEP